MKKQAEIVTKEGKLNEINVTTFKRPNGTVRIQQDFEFCPTLTEQHTSHLSDINYLIQKYKPDELAAYIAARNQHRQEILGHDFSREPSLQEAKNIVYQLNQNFQKLPDEIRNQFKNHVEFLKFIDNPLNQEKLIKLGLMTKKEIAEQTGTPSGATQEQSADTSQKSDLPKTPKT